MNYEQKYKEALERARVYHTGGSTTDAHITETIFPELVESEDEKIRKEILNAIKQLDEGTTIYGRNYDYAKWLAWLEKQGEQKSVEWHKKDEQNLNACLGYIPDEFLRRWLKDIVHVKYDKSADKYEPKFKVGDWITHNMANFVFRIINVGSNGYDVVNRENYKHTISFYSEDEYHLWTIQDANDGDVLAEDSCIFIIQKLEDNSTAAKTYCKLYDDGDFVDGSILSFDIDSTKPATKEQRELLFKKMKEASYEWDADKKELKKAKVVSKESEDEEIRKEIVDFIISSNKYGTNERCEAWLNWLEKQETSYSNGVSDGIEKGYNSAIEKACEWLQENLTKYIIQKQTENCYYPYYVSDKLYNNFKQAMKL